MTNQPKKPLPPGAIWAIVGVSLFLGALLRSNPQPPRRLEETPDIPVDLPACVAETNCTCADFTYQQDAMVAIQQNNSLGAKLDGDQDGYPCESLPSTGYDDP